MTAEAFELIANVLPEPMLLVTASGKVVATNQPMRQMLGASFTPGQQQNVSDIFKTPTDKIKEYLKLCSGVRQFVPGTLKLKSGVEPDLRCEGAGVNDSDASQPLVILRLKTKLAAAERFHLLNGQIELLNQEIRKRIKLEETNRWTSAIVESSGDAIISKDLNGIIISCNQGASHLFGYEVAELIGQPMTTLIPAHHQGEEKEILVRIQRGERIENLETIRQRKDGSLVEVSLTISPVKDIHGKIIGASKIARNITERKRAEQKLTESLQREKAARELAESANCAKDDFLASLSHELRTPLNPVLLIASDAADNPDLPPEIRNNFESIRKNIELEARLIDDLLDLTRINHGKLSLHFRMLDAQVVLQEAIANVLSDVNEKQIQMDINWQSPDAIIYGDAVRLQQVFWNVLKNAVKFTPTKGKIIVATTISDGRLSIDVTDNGIGMTQKEIGRIFDAFSQGDHAGSASHRFGGLGLGLAISHRLVELHSGKIHAHSAGQNQGATFIIELPLAKKDKDALLLTDSRAENRLVTPKSGNGACILLIEDHEPTRNALAHLLNRRQYKVLVAGGVAEAREISAKKKIDLVISDIGLPDGNGNDLMKELQQRFGLKGIALTGYGMEQDVEQSLASGFVTHLIKPVNVRSLEHALESLAAS
jgi:PAS domain S-box-containing protein